MGLYLFHPHMQQYLYKLVTVYVLLLICMSAGAESLVPSTMPLEASITPSTTVPGGVVTISGTATALRDNRLVNITLTSPDGDNQIFNVSVDAARNYSQIYRVPFNTMGRYTVLVKGPGGQGQESLSFDVVSFSSQRDQIKQKLSTVISKTRAIINNIHTIIERSPVSPTQQEALEKVSQLREMIAQSDTHVEAVDAALQIIDDITGQVPPMAEHLTPVYDRMYSELSEADHILSATPPGNDHNVCDGLYYTGQGLKTASLAFTMASGAVSTSYSLLQGLSADTLVSGMPVSYRNAATRGIINQGINRTVERIQDPSASMARLAGAITDLVPMFIDGVFELFCQKFSGTVQASLNVNMRENGTTWLKYDEEIDAVINVRYQRTNDSDSIHVTGEIEGVGSKFKAWENFSVLDPRVRKDILVRFMIQPLPGSLSAVSTTGLAGVFTPAYFRVPVRGELTGNKLKLSLDAATQDFRESKKATSVYVLVSPSAPIPYVLTSKLPFQSAHFMLTRSLGGAPEFDITVDRSAKIMRIKKNAVRNADMDNGNISLKFVTNLNACNPECP
ncbi:MAG: hypothetical protein OEZ16_01780 [Chromatiales bacterium]|nr:hypothetical protein [Chromatiales bacterium]